MRPTALRWYWAKLVSTHASWSTRYTKASPHIKDRIKNGEYTYIVNATADRPKIKDFKLIHRSALQYKVYYNTTLNGRFATAMALKADPTEQVISVQEMHARFDAITPGLRRVA